MRRATQKMSSDTSLITSATKTVVAPALFFLLKLGYSVAIFVIQWDSTPYHESI